MKNQVIKSLTPEHGKKIIEYWQSKGVDTGNKSGVSCESGHHLWIYYGVISGIFDNYSFSQVKNSNAEIIELPEDEFDMTTNEGRLAYAKKHYPIGTKYRALDNNGQFCQVANVNYPPILVYNSDNIDCGIGYIYANNKWAEIVEEKQEEKAMETQRLSRQGLKEIHSVACSYWKGILENFGARNPLEDYIELTQKEVDDMFTACNKEQLPIVSKYLKQDDISVDLRYINGDKHGLVLNCEYLLRVDDLEADYKSFWLNNKFNWEIKLVNGFQRLIPTKKK